MVVDANFVPCDEDEVYWNLAYSENDSESRHGAAWRQALGPRLSGLLGTGDRAALTEQDCSRLRSTFHIVRGGYLEPLLRLGPKWHLGDLETRRLTEIRLIRLEAFQAIAPSRLLGEFVRALDADRDTPDDRFAARYRRLRPRFDSNRMLGRPILIGESFTGPLTEVDGLTRMSMLLSRLNSGEPVPEEFPVLLGISARLRDWEFY